jgi:hypothetical protein
MTDRLVEAVYYLIMVNKNSLMNGDIDEKNNCILLIPGLVFLL